MGCSLSSLLDSVLDEPQAPAPAQTHGQQNQTEKLSPVYAALPEDAEAQTVRNVYDGDTLTLVDERRVRLVGIDTPEIKEKQPFSQEAKAYTKKHCPNNGTIYLSFDSNGDKEDHYGRLLALVWVPAPNDPSRYLCVNEGIVQQGLAYVYFARKDLALQNREKLLALQQEARVAKSGIWATFVDIFVLATPNGSAYHIAGCRHLKKSGNLMNIKVSAASDMGLHPCRTCLGDS